MQTNSKTASLQTIWGQFPTTSKFALFATFATIIGVILPWYSDLDLLRSGDVFSGVSGPVYFHGYSIIAASLAVIFINLASVIQPGLSNNRSKKLGLFRTQMILAGFSVYSLVAANTVLFDSRFGLNILSKQAEWGSALTLAGLMTILVTGYLSWRSEQFSSNDNQLIKEVNKAKEQRQKEEVLEREMPEPTRSQPTYLDRVHSTPNRNKPVEKAPTPSKTTHTQDQKALKYYENMKRMMEKDTLKKNQPASANSVADKVVPNSWYRPGL